jgi:Ca2+-binding RTX toxin-like protein
MTLPSPTITRFRLLLALFMLASPLAAQSASFKASIERRTLRIEGTDAAETIIAEVMGDPASINIEYRGPDAEKASQKVSFRLDAFDRLILNARGGADFVNIIDIAQLLDSQKKILKLDGGDGDNVVVLSHLPFKLETATRIKSLLDLSKQLEDVAKRASEATSQALRNDAMKFIENVRVNLADVSRSMAADAQKQVFDPARQLVDHKKPELIDWANSMVGKGEDIAKQHDALVAELTKKYDPTNGVFPRDDNREPTEAKAAKSDADLPESDAAKEKEVEAVRVRVEQLAQAGMKLGDDVRAQLEQRTKLIENDTTGIEQRAAEFEKRAEQLSAAADALAVQGEKDMTAAADRVVSVVAELKSMEKNFQEVGLLLRDEFQRAISLTPKLQAKTVKPAATAKPGKIAKQPGAGACTTPIVTTHTYTGSGIFLPIAAPTASWSITGGSGNDILVGGFAADDIHAGAGNDVVFGLSGNDHIHGDDGVDFLFGEFLLDWGFTGDDCIWGDNGVDIVIGDNGIETPWGTSGGDDHLWGGKDVDIVVGDDVFPDILKQNLPGGTDTMEGNDDIDIQFGCGGDDTIDGNDDMDFVEGNGGDDIIDGGDGRNFSFCNTTVDVGNLLLGGWGDDTITGGDGIDVILGDRNNDTLTGNDQVDIEFGGSGKDTMYGDAGGTICVVSGVPIRLGNFMVGGDDNDTMWAGGDLDVMLGWDGDDKIYGYDGSLQKPFAIDADLLLGGKGDDYLEGDKEQIPLLLSVDFIFGGPGNDELHGGNDIDFMFGGPGVDTMFGDSNSLLLATSMDLMLGGPDADWMDGGNGLDVMFGQGGNDTMLGDDETAGLFSPDFMWGGPGDDTMNGGEAFDLMWGEGGADHMLGDSNYAWELLSMDLMWGGPGDDFMDGGNFSDLMFGGPDCDTMLGDNSTPGRISSDIMLGGSGNDNMDGGNGMDFMSGGDDNDTMFGDKQLGQPFSVDFMFGNDGCDTMFGGQGFDIMFGGPGVDHMDGQLGPDLMIGGANGDTMNGGDSLDFIFGNDGNDLIHGNDFMDWISGGDGDDCLYGDDGPDFVSGGNGDDCIHGGRDPDVLAGDNGNDLIFGDNGPDYLSGGSGDDKLDGGSGFDAISGGSGTDEGWRGPGGWWSGLFFSVETKHNGSSGLDCNCQTEVCTGKICVHKFNDLNGDGIQNTGELGLQGWVFQIASSCAGGTLVTDASGNACGDFFAGTYPVVEQMQGGWTPTTATTQNATVVVGQTTNVNFGNQQPGGDLCITKFDDKNGNGVQDSGEVVLPNWTFIVTDPAGTTSTLVTDSQGHICQHFPVGTCTVAEQLQSGWVAITPATQTVVIIQGQTTNINFGNQKQGNGSLCIKKFNDLNSNGALDNGEPLITWSFTVTDSSGASTIFVFNPALPPCKPFPAGTYTITEQSQAGWTPTTLATQSVTVTTGSSVTVYFGNRQ